MIDLAAWADEEKDPRRRLFRVAVQLVVRAIAQSNELAPVMVMKGGTLLAIRYGSSRFTKDIDFSTSRKFENVDLPNLMFEFERAIQSVSAENESGMALRIQSHVLQPSNQKNPTFPTLKIKIGYALRSTQKQMEHLRRGSSSDVVQIDYSFNEWECAPALETVDGGTLATYSFHDLMAEKLRSILQQPIRRRERFQDIYDIVFLLRCVALISEKDRAHILDKLTKSVEGRGVQLGKSAMRDPELERLSKIGYETELPMLVRDQLPTFEEAFMVVRNFFESLPWD